MFPILYDYNEQAFTSNGIGRLLDIISATVTEERNGRFDMEFQYPVNGIHFDDITEGRIIAVTHDEDGDIQPFVIYSSSKPIDGVVTFNACHISYRLSDYVMPNKTYVGIPYFQVLLDAQGYIDSSADPFTLTTDIAGSVIFPWNTNLPRSIRDFLGGSENSFLFIVGGGEFKFDKWTVSLMANRGSNNGVSIRYGKNLADFKAETDYSEAFNAIMPYYNGDYGTDQKGVIYYPGVVGSHTLPGNRRAWRVMDFTDQIEGKGKSIPTIQSELHTLANDYLNNHNTWEPSVSIDVDFVQLWQTDEYKDFAPLLKCKLCDTVNVTFPYYGLADLAVKIVSVEWDVLNERYKKMTLGGFATTLEQSINSNVSGAIKANAEAIAQVDNRSYVSDVTVNGTSVVTDGVAAITEPTWSGLTLTRTTNNYVNATNFNRLSARKIGKLGLLFFNLQFSTSMPTGTNETVIGTLTGATIARQVLQTIPSQSNNATIMLDITTAGNIMVSNYSGTATGTNFFRAVVPIELS